MGKARYTPAALAKMSLPLLCASCAVELNQYLSQRPTLLERTQELGQRLLTAANASEADLACNADVRSMLAAVRRAVRGAEDVESGKELQRYAARKGKWLAEVSHSGSAPQTELLDMRSFTMRLAQVAQRPAARGRPHPPSAT